MHPLHGTTSSGVKRLSPERSRMVLGSETVGLSTPQVLRRGQGVGL